MRTIEPNVSPGKLVAGKIDKECVYTIAGFVAYISTCSPGAMRIQSGPLKASLEATAVVLDANGMLSNSPPSLGGKTLTDLVNNGAVKFTVDQKYPQAIGINSILSLTAMIGNSQWQILNNEIDAALSLRATFLLPSNRHLTGEC